MKPVAFLVAAVALTCLHSCAQARVIGINVSAVGAVELMDDRCAPGAGMIFMMYDRDGRNVGGGCWKRDDQHIYARETTFDQRFVWPVGAFMRVDPK